MSYRKKSSFKHMGRISKKILKKTILTILGAILSFAFLEVFVRLFFYQNITPSRVIPAFGISNALRPNYEKVSLNPVGIKYKIQTNNNQFRRSSPVEYEKPPNTFRILCLGDSITYGLWLSNNEIYPYYLENILNRERGEKRFEVLNAGAPGSKPIDYYLYLKNEGIKYSPDLVIIASVAPELTELKSEFFKFEKVTLKKSTNNANISLINPEIKPYDNSFSEKARSAILNFPFFLEMSDVSQHLNLIRKNLSIDFYQTQKSPNSFTSLIENKGIISKDIVNWNIKIDSENLKFDQSSLSELKKILYAITQKKIKILANKNHFKLAWVKMPYAPEVFGTIPHRIESKKFLILKPDTINFLEEFKAFGGKHPIPLFFPGDTHFTPSGNRLFAYLLINHLFESKKINKKSLDINLLATAQEIEKANGTTGERIKKLPVWNLILAKKYKSLHQLSSAEKSLKLYLDQEPNSGEGLFQMGLINYELKQWDKALKFLKQAFKLNRYWGFENLNLQAKIYYQKKDYSNAEKFWIEAIKVNPNSAKTHRNLGSLYFDNGHFQKAVERYESSLQINPNSYEVYLVSGLAYLKLQKMDKAINMFQNVLRLQPNNMMAKGVLKQLKSFQ